MRREERYNNSINHSGAVMKKAAKNRISPAALSAAVYLCLLGTALPLTVHDAYFDITRTKATVFWILSGALMAAAVLCFCLDREERKKLRPFTLSDWLFLAFALTHIVSTLILGSSASALLAPDNRYQGILSFSLYLGMFLFLRRFGLFSRPVRFAMLLGFSAAALLGVSEIFGADLLGIRAVSPERELIRFLSTIGNISFFSALCVLFLPLASGYAISADTPRHALPYALCALLALCGGLASRAEGFLLGALLFFAVLPLLYRDPAVLRRVPLLWAFSSAAALLFTAAMERWALYRPSDLTRLLCRPALLIPLCLLAVLAFLALRRTDERRTIQIRKVYIIIFWVLLGAAALFLILANTLWRRTLPASLASFAVFSPSWGSDRGAEWASFWQMFRSASLPQKLFGSGAGSVAAWDRAHRLFSDAVTDSAHNEYLHYLLTGGLVGLLSYLGLLVCAVRKAVRLPSRGRSAAALACLAYAVQAAVNIAQPFTTPLFLALLSLLHSDDAFAEDDRGHTSVFWYVAVCALAVVLLLAAAEKR